MLSNYEVSSCALCQCFDIKRFALWSKEMKVLKCHVRFVCLCFSGVQTPDRPEGTKEGQRKEQAQCRAAELKHHHVWGRFTSAPSLHSYHIHIFFFTTIDPLFPLHFHTDTEVLVEDALQQTESRDRQRVPHHHDAPQTHKVSTVWLIYILYIRIYAYIYVFCVLYTRWWYFPPQCQGREAAATEPPATDGSGNSASECFT